VRDPLGYLRANLTGSLNLLEAMRTHGVRRLVFSSSAAVYGAPFSVPVQESVPLRPTSPAGAWKLAVEQAIGFEATAGGLGAVSLRSFNVAGARGPLGEWHHPETHLIPLLLQVAAGVRPVVRVFGTDYDTRDGTALRDYVHVDDVARAHVLALEATVEPGHLVCNLGSGVGCSVREVIDLALAATGQRIPSVDAPRRLGDPAVLVASTERARRDLGWVATRSTTDAIVDAWEWMRARIGAGDPEPTPVVGC
jgi:UDP-glucose 4-epimerase